MARFRFVWVPAVALGCAAIPAPLLRQALAATAGTLFEAAPFVLALALGRGRLMRPFVALAGCGCGASAGPAALSIPATALCWAIFGPAVALGRFGAALVLLAAARKSPGGRHDEPDPLAMLSSIAAPAFVLGVATALLQSGHFWGVRLPVSGPALALIEGACGLAAGALAPCTTGAVALAGMLRGTAPFAAAGILASAGLVTIRGVRPANDPPPQHDARFGLILLGLACAAIVLRDGAGFVHPRLVPFLWLAIPAALFAARGRPATRLRASAGVPAIMLAALVLGSPVPGPSAVASTPGDLYPGEAIAFSGTATRVRGRIVLVRYAIVCCRADASAIAMPTNLKVRVAPEAWIEVRGSVARDESGMFVRVLSWQRVAAPADPYLYL